MLSKIRWTDAWGDPVQAKAALRAASSQEPMRTRLCHGWRWLLPGTSHDDEGQSDRHRTATLTACIEVITGRKGYAALLRRLS